jgi:hypothetical protein
MTWTDVINTDNTWLDRSLLYVLAGYWQDGYVVDNENQWSEQSESSNTWVVIG